MLTPDPIAAAAGTPGAQAPKFKDPAASSAPGLSSGRPSPPGAQAPKPNDPPAGKAFWKRHPVDIRFALPLLGGWFYVTVVSGPEKRSAERRAEQRHHYPIRTAANIFFVFGLGGAFYALALVVFAFASSILEW